MKAPTTNNLEFWLEHSLAADSSKLPLADYARQHQ